MRAGETVRRVQRVSESAAREALAKARIEAVAPSAPPEETTRVPPCVLVVFGAGGDLTRRKLIPALAHLFAHGRLPERFAVVGIARASLTDDTFREQMGNAVAEFAPEIEAGLWRDFAAHLHYVQGEFQDPETFQRLREKLTGVETERDLPGNRLYYLATPSSEFDDILRGLQGAGMIRARSDPQWSRVVIEKPFGHDLESARGLNTLVGRVLHESQTFRIDHYLGKETVQNILVFRFANSFFEPLWNRKYVDHVEISAMETVGVGTRGKFYEATGVLRDIVQNHLLEVLSLVAMEPPNSGDADDIRGEKLKILRALRDPRPDTIPRDLVLGQYRGYREEPNVAPDSVTPTFAALRVFVDNWRWQGVPFYLRAGKKLQRRVTEVSIHLQAIPLCLFGREDTCEHIEPNVLTLRIQPDEGIELRFASKVPGHDLAIGTVAMDMKYVEAFGGEPPEAYERLLLDAIRGDATLFSRRDAVEASWEWITPMLEHLREHPPKDFPNYEPGSWGPECCDDLMRQDRRTWRAL